MKILLISHGDFAAGLCSTLRNFFGAENVYAACVTQENGTADMLAAANRYLHDWGNEQVVICSDLKSGSANQAALPLRTRPNTFLISGMNLSLVLQIQMEDAVTAESLQEMIETAKQDMLLLNDNAAGVMDEDDE